MRLKEESRESFHSCEGCATLFETMNCGNKKICSFVGLQMELDAIFAEGEEEGESFLGKRSARLEELLTRCCFADEEVAKYAKVSPQLWLPYTRNLVHENENYTILVLVWQPMSQSKIHSHPCDGCIITPLKGEVSESVYEAPEGSTDEENLVLKKVQHFKKGQVGFMSDHMKQYHKIESQTGCISLHLYTPPFQRCRIWVPVEQGEGKLGEEKLGEERAYKSREVGSQLYSIKGVAPPPESFREYDLEYYI